MELRATSSKVVKIVEDPIVTLKQGNKVVYITRNGGIVVDPKNNNTIVTALNKNDKKC